jgi:integrase
MPWRSIQERGKTKLCGLQWARILKAAKVRPITIHGLRHTSATVLLKAGVPAHVVQQRLGHKRVEITLGIYAHVLPSLQQDAARRLGSLLYGSTGFVRNP